MIQMETSLGTIEISQEYFRHLIGQTAASCYGVTGMVTSGARQGWRAMVTRRQHVDDGVKVSGVGGKLVIDLHIEVLYGMNIAAIAQSIVHKVRYVVEQATGLTVKKVNVFVDAIKE